MGSVIARCAVNFATESHEDFQCNF